MKLKKCHTFRFQISFVHCIDGEVLDVDSVSHTVGSWSTEFLTQSVLIICSYCLCYLPLMKYVESSIYPFSK